MFGLANIYHMTRVLSSTEAFNFKFEKVGKNGKNAGKGKTFLRIFVNCLGQLDKPLID